jgi:hypothetical protein
VRSTIRASRGEARRSGGAAVEPRAGLRSSVGPPVLR